MMERDKKEGFLRSDYQIDLARLMKAAWIRRVIRITAANGAGAERSVLFFLTEMRQRQTHDCSCFCRECFETVFQVYFFREIIPWEPVLKSALKIASFNLKVRLAQFPAAFAIDA